MLNPTGFHRITNRLELRSTAFHTLTRMSCRPVDSEQKNRPVVSRASIERRTFPNLANDRGNVRVAQAKTYNARQLAGMQAIFFGLLVGGGDASGAQIKTNRPRRRSPEHFISVALHQKPSGVAGVLGHD